MVRVVALLILLAASAPLAAAAQSEAATWQQTSLTIPVQQLFAPASGAFFALTTGALMRSNDGGVTWESVAVPRPPARRSGRWAAVDPTNHTVLYAAGDGGLYQTRDDAATWQLIQAGPSPTAVVAAIAVSPADPRMLYAIFQDGNTLHFYYSADGGASWASDALSTAGSPCQSRVDLLEAHPTDPRRAFRAAGCFSGRDAAAGEALWQSADSGVTWTQSYREPGTRPTALAGSAGRGGAPLYLGLSGAGPNLPSLLARSDDNGATWASVQQYAGGSVAGTQLTGLAVDPTAPLHVYLGLSGLLQGVRRSDDGGATWTELGLSDQPVNDLALGIDQRNLFAATATGVWRLAVTP